MDQRKERVLFVVTVASALVTVIALLRDITDFKVTPDKIDLFFENNSWILWLSFTVTSTLTVHLIAIHKQKLEARRLEEGRQLTEARRLEEVRQLAEVRRLEKARQVAEAQRLEKARKLEEAQKQEEASKSKNSLFFDLPPISDDITFMSDEYLSKFTAEIMKTMNQNDDIKIEDKTIE